MLQKVGEVLQKVGEVLQKVGEVLQVIFVAFKGLLVRIMLHVIT